MAPSKSIRWPLLCLGVIVAIMALKPGNTPWFFDMSRNLDLALKANATPSRIFGIQLPFTPSTIGNKGTHGMHYGPLPVWFDQILLVFTHNPIVMTEIRTVFCGVLTSLALLWLAVVLDVSPWLAVITMLSPWMWYYTRELWDNMLAIPPTALLLASYGDFLKNRRGISLCIAIVSAAAMCLVHVTGLPFILPLALHLIFYDRALLWKFKWPALICLVVMGAISWPFVHYMLTFHGAKVPEYVSHWHGWIFPLLGGQHLTAYNMGYILESGWRTMRPRPLMYLWLAARIVSVIGLVFCWVGMLMGIPKAMRALQRSPAASVTDHLCLIGWATFLCLILFDGIEHVSGHPHYHNNTWIVFIMFAWLPVNALLRYNDGRNIGARLIIPAWVASLVICTILLQHQIVRDGGTRSDHYNAILANQWAVARQVASYPPNSPIDIKIPYWLARPETAPVLFELARYSTPVTHPPSQLVIRFRNAFPNDARLVVEAHPLAQTPR